MNKKLIFIFVTLISFITHEINAARNPLHDAVKKGNDIVLQNLIDTQNYDVNEQDSYGCTPLHYAAEYGHTKCVRILLSNNANVKLVNNLDNTPLHYATWNGHIDCLSAIIEHDTNSVNFKNYFHRTPLHFAASWGRLDCVKYLVEHGGANIHAKTDKEKTPKDLALFDNHEEVAIYLQNKEDEELEIKEPDDNQ